MKKFKLLYCFVMFFFFVSFCFGTDRNSKEYESKYPLHNAVYNKNFKQIRQLIKDGELNFNKLECI